MKVKMQSIYSAVRVGFCKCFFLFANLSYFSNSSFSPFLVWDKRILIGVYILVEPEFVPKKKKICPT
jgi:hypothetical protein